MDGVLVLWELDLLEEGEDCGVGGLLEEGEDCGVGGLLG